MYICIYVYKYMYINICIYVYIASHHITLHHIICIQRCMHITWTYVDNVDIAPWHLQIILSHPQLSVPGTAFFTVSLLSSVFQRLWEPKVSVIATALASLSVRPRSWRISWKFVIFLMRSDAWDACDGSKYVIFLLHYIFTRHFTMMLPLHCLTLYYIVLYAF